MSRPKILVVGGIDRSGGAGLDADREAAAEVEVDVTAVASAYTDQDEHEVRSVGPAPPYRWLERAQAALGDSAAIKFGLLPGLEHMRAAKLLMTENEVEGRRPVVLDPVIRSTSGYLFLDESALEALLIEVLPLGPILTPNLPEAARLTGVELMALQGAESACVEAAQMLLDLGAGAVVLKGGHGVGETARDLVLAANSQPEWLARERVSGPGLRGTGCRFATALAGLLALGRELAPAAEEAGRYVARRIGESDPG